MGSLCCGISPLTVGLAACRVAGRVAWTRSGSDVPLLCESASNFHSHRVDFCSLSSHRWHFGLRALSSFRDTRSRGNRGSLITRSWRLWERLPVWLPPRRYCARESPSSQHHSRTHARTPQSGLSQFHDFRFAFLSKQTTQLTNSGYLHIHQLTWSIIVFICNINININIDSMSSTTQTVTVLQLLS